VPLMFGSADFKETPTLKQSNAFDIVAKQCMVVQEVFGLFGITGFSRYEITRVS
jgi:dimethylglycine dehydrogenase